MIKRLLIGGAALITLRALFAKRGGECLDGQRHNAHGNYVGRPGLTGLRHRKHRGNVTPFDDRHRFRHGVQPVSV